MYFVCASKLFEVIAKQAYKIFLTIYRSVFGSFSLLRPRSHAGEGSIDCDMAKYFGELLRHLCIVSIRIEIKMTLMISVHYSWRSTLSLWRPSNCIMRQLRSLA
ncbi:MAG: hypothetical protein A3I66_03410 [Burkholderiales bacterium RIFCSPLOWO2_02_FULL_57_36]|nr:MAG: hypothetical protein A3I66_03410 [Burkholderiales bacterium RIFCSPLOWO2_02_FULL_57_36]